MLTVTPNILFKDYPIPEKNVMIVTIEMDNYPMQVKLKNVVSTVKLTSLIMTNINMIIK